MKKLQVSYSFEVCKFVEIDVNELVDYLTDDDDTLDKVVEKYIDDYKNDCFTIDSSDDVDGYTSYLEITKTIEETEDDYEYLEDKFTIEDLKLLKDQKKYNL